MNAASWHRNTCLLALKLSVDHILGERDFTEEPSRAPTDRKNAKENILSVRRSNMQTDTRQAISVLSRHESPKRANSGKSVALSGWNRNRK